MNKIHGRKTLFSSLKISIFGVTFVVGGERGGFYTWKTLVVF